jgi:hypothetical protein
MLGYGTRSEPTIADNATAAKTIVQWESAADCSLVVNWGALLNPLIIR